ncbi:lytic polysaccharide monooxygenase [Saccharata proteae CBS 121410]|uniref:Lytic polysaccharide monooxygenase n=1 Tax=Saccharata proteae CBS 121410 TaxID=1314787 RepID=A0A9P4HUX4_9PEZI|nr:lytic polysaccharide monooxygenase [Saccharata proteae CBS 121410]
MISKFSLAAAALLAAPLASAHMIMANPVPYSDSTIDNSPLTSADFPCKLKNGYTVSKMNDMTVGDAQTLSFKGSAIHGGGSCQLSVSLDLEPSKKSTFKVIHSIEGGCPGINSPSTFNFSIPDSIPNGKSTFAWTWFSKLSGAPELYMNCAPITVTGGASDDTKYNALPDMLVANLGDYVDCTSPQSADTKYPDPGDSVEVDNASDLKLPTGSACGSTAKASGAATSAAGAASGAADAGASSSAAGGGVFVPNAATPSSTLTTVITKTASIPAVISTPAYASTPVAISTPVYVSTPAAAASTPGSSTGSSSTCSTEGAVVCNGSTQFGLCNNGSVVWQPVAAGTTCSNGQITRRDGSAARAHHFRGGVHRGSRHE